MQQSEAFQQQLREAYAAIVVETFARARHCLALARIARRDGDSLGLRKWIWCVRVLRMAAAGWRARARYIVPALLCLVLPLVGSCAKPDTPTIDLVITADQDDGSVAWQLTMPEKVWRAMQPTATSGQTFEFNPVASKDLTGWIDDELARKNLCAHQWHFTGAIGLADGTLVFSGRCDQRLVRS